ncbi:MAG: NADP oxidoreductase, partial [Spirochaetes bacterium]|nr:NADP oxidoreductase [Spirochaetota bacterium]
MTGTNHLLRFAAPQDPHDLDAYRTLGGYEGLAKAVKLEPAQAVEQVRRSRLAGRGGAGVDAGFKWSTVPRGEDSYIVCNADEGEPGTFKDRFLME